MVVATASTCAQILTKSVASANEGTKEISHLCHTSPDLCHTDQIGQTQLPLSFGLVDIAATIKAESHLPLRNVDSI